MSHYGEQEVPVPEAAFDEEGRYLIKEVLGTGAFGVVYRAFDTRWKQELALKSIRQVSPEDRQRLKAEYRNLRDIVHPNLVGLHELHVDGEHCFFTMDLVTDGRPFVEGLDFNRDAPVAIQRSAIRRVCMAAVQLAEGLHTVHSAGKCHGDVKPTNVLIAGDDKVILLDFGLTRSVARTAEFDTAKAMVLGTLRYLAPEQYYGAAPLPTSDWYSVGLVLYEALTGVAAFEGEALEVALAKRQRPPALITRLPALPAELDALILGMLDPDPERRPDGEHILSQLKEVAGDQGVGELWRPSDNEFERIFVARDQELAALENAYADCAAGCAVTVEIVGPSGIGKTVLVRRFLDSMNALPALPLVLEAHCHPHESIPYKAFDAAIDDLARYWMGLPQAAAQALCPEEGLAALTLLFPELRRVPLLNLTPASGLRRGDPRTLRQTGFLALRNVLSCLSRSRPVVLWVDDIHWADSDSVALIEAVFGGENPPAVLLIFSRRPDGEAVQPALLGAIEQLAARAPGFRLDLGPLTLDSASTLARTIIARTGLASSELVDAVVRQAAGLPFLVSELADFAARHKAALPAGVPRTTATALMRQRLGVLPAEDRVLLELAALAGVPQEPAVLLEAAGSQRRHRLRDLCVLRLLRWTAVGDKQWLQVYHDRLREFIVGGLNPDDRRRHHMALVAAMEKADSLDAEQMLVHALAAGDSARTHKHAKAAAHRATDALAFEQAARLYEIALEYAPAHERRAELHALLAEALANAGRSTRSAPEFEQALTALGNEDPEDKVRGAFYRRRAGEQYLKAGHFDDGLRLMSSVLAEVGVKLPKSGNGALAISAWRRLRLYLRGFDIRENRSATTDPNVHRRLEDLWAATTSLSMMDPVRADGVGLLHFHEALNAANHVHIARSCGYEAAFAALIGGDWLRAKARMLLELNESALKGDVGPYERAFYLLGAGASAFFQSDWASTVEQCDEATRRFRNECQGTEYEAAVALVYSLQALGQAGAVSKLIRRIPEAISEADDRGDLFAANSHRGGFHALGRIAAGQLDIVQADLRKVVQTWTRGFYQMHAYHRVFAGVAADLYIGDPHSALARIEGDWPELEAGLFLRMELPAMELRWARARACLAVASVSGTPKRERLLSRVRSLTRQVFRATAAASKPHAALLRAGVAAVFEKDDAVVPELRIALAGYASAKMAIHREVVRWTLGHLVGGEEGRALTAETTRWMQSEGVPDMLPLVAAVAPGLDRAVA